MTIHTSLTVYFEDPFWVGVFERESQGLLEAAKVTFGAEPKDYQVYGYFLQNWDRLRFSPPVASQADAARRQNPKWMQRAIRARLGQTGVGTRAQQALKKQQEQAGAQRHARRREKKEQEKEARYLLRRQKKR